MSNIVRSSRSLGSCGDNESTDSQKLCDVVRSVGTMQWEQGVRWEAAMHSEQA